MRSLTVCALLALTATVDASYRDGYVNQYGYTYHAASGYWRWGTPGYYTYWRYVPAYGCNAAYYQQVQYYPPYPQATPENYKEILAKSLANTKAHDEFMEAMKLAYPEYVDQPKRRLVEDKVLYPQSSTTIQIGQSSFDINLTLQQMLRALEFNQTTSASIGADVLDAVKLKVSGDNENMRALVQGIADAERLRAARSPLVVQKQYQIGVAKEGPPHMPEVFDPPPGVGLKTVARDFAVLRQDCAACHSGAKTSGGFNVDAFLTLPLERRVAIVHGNIMGKDAKKGMPRGADGQWHRLPDNKITAWFDFALSGK